MAMLAQLAGEEALQAERFGLITADDVRAGDSHCFVGLVASRSCWLRRESRDLHESRNDIR
jgi:hypothetical protein